MSDLPSENVSSICYPVIHLTSEDRDEFAKNLGDSDYTSEEVPLALPENHSSTVYYGWNIRLDTSDAQSEATHTYDSAALLLIMFLLFMTIITIWIFKVRRFRVLHETGLSLIYGIVIGVILRYAIPTKDLKEFVIVNKGNSTCNGSHLIEVGEEVIVQTVLGETFSCSIEGNVFKDTSGNYIQQSLLFDPEVFFFVLLPPIIFYAGYSLQKRHFFRNLGSLLLYAFAGTTISTSVVGMLMFGYVRSGLEAEGSAIANITHNPVPEKFKINPIPSLLFGSLISATDPVTVLAIFHDLHVDHDLYSLVFGESVMNDAVAIVLFRTVDEYSTGGGGEAEEFQVASVFESLGMFIGIFLGSFILGCAMGLLTALLMKFSKLRDYPLLETSLFIIMSYSTYLFAEVFQLTGIVAVLFCGIMQSYYTFINLSEESRRRSKELFELINFLAENFVFSYMGLSLFTYNNHQWVPGFIVFSFISILIGRVLNIYILSFFLNLGRSKKISFRFQHMLVFAGLRGAIAFALAIRNTQTEARQLIFTTTLVIVLVTVFVCGGLTTLMLQFLKIKVGVEDDSEHLEEDGEIIPHSKAEGNYFVSKFSILNKNYLLPIFTHRARSLDTFCPSWLSSFCGRCNPYSEHKKLEEEEEESGSSGGESDSDKGRLDEEDAVLSFRHPDGGANNTTETLEGDLGLGMDKDGSSGGGGMGGGGMGGGGGYQRLANQFDNEGESSF